eukprot:1291467-Rhodomonas_salina.2
MSTTTIGRAYGFATPCAVLTEVMLLPGAFAPPGPRLECGGPGRVTYHITGHCVADAYQPTGHCVAHAGGVRISLPGSA